MGHSNFLSVSWVRLCRLRLAACRKLLPQAWQVYLFASVWTTRWLLSSLAVLNSRSQASHLWFFEQMWQEKSSKLEKTRRQTGQKRSMWSRRWCFFSWFGRRNFSPHWSTEQMISSDLDDGKPRTRLFFSLGTDFLFGRGGGELVGKPESGLVTLTGTESPSSLLSRSSHIGEGGEDKVSVWWVGRIFSILSSLVWSSTHASDCQLSLARSRS